MRKLTPEDTAALDDGEPVDHFLELECTLVDARRVAGAMRAVHCLTFKWKGCEPEEVVNVDRSDLAQLFEVLAADLGHQLDTADRHLAGLGVERQAGRLVARARGAQR